MAVSLPYDVIKAIEEAVPQKDQAEKVVRAIEQSLCAIRKEAQERETVVKVQVEDAIRGRLKEELVTRAEFREEIVKVQLLLKVSIALMLAGFTLFNPGFQAFVKALVALFK